MRTLAALALAGLYVASLWIASSVFRGKGLVVAILGLLLLWLALSEYKRQRRGFFHRVVLLMAGCAAATLACEALLWQFPGLLRGPLANYVSHGYHGEPGGIYVRDPLLAHAMRPAFTRRMYWNGHTWTHSTNVDGYRGPRLERADALVLGDTAVYGQGVEADQTLPARFAAATGLATANLGQQGTCWIQGLELLRRTGLRLKPRLILVGGSATNVVDALHWYAPEELERFVAQPGYRPLARESYRTPTPLGVFELWQQRVALPLRAGRALQAVISPPPDRVLQTPTAPRNGERFLPSDETRSLPFTAEAADALPEDRLGWQASRQALGEIGREARGIGARVIVFDMGYPTAYSAAVARLARELDLTYSDAGHRILARAQAGEEMYLAGDGHWTPAGCDAMARELAATAAR